MAPLLYAGLAAVRASAPGFQVFGYVPLHQDLLNGGQDTFTFSQRQADVIQALYEPPARVLFRPRDA